MNISNNTRISANVLKIAGKLHEEHKNIFQVPIYEILVRVPIIRGHEQRGSNPEKSKNRPFRKLVLFL